MAITDLVNNPIDPSSASFRGYSASAADLFPHDIYSFLIHSVREQDMVEGEELILRWLASEQSEFEDTYERIESLQTLPDPANCSAEALPYLKWIVGLTSRLDGVTGDISDDDLRRLISVAARMWKLKGTERGMADTLRALTTRTARVLNWFFFRIIMGEVELGREELDVDPWLLDVPGMQPSIVPDAVISEGPILDMNVLPSADTPPWSYVNEGATDTAIFSVSGGKLVHAQDNDDALGGRYILTTPNDMGTAQVGAIWKATDLTKEGGRPFHLYLRDGLRSFVLAWSSTEVALEDLSGNVVEGPRSKGFSLNTDYRIRLYKDGTGYVRASVDDQDLFGQIDATLFPGTAIQQYGFGYINLGEDQDWICVWDDVGPIPELTFDLTTLLGSTEAVPHGIRVKHIPSNSVRTVYSYWDGSKNRCRVLDAFGRSAPFDVNLNDFRVGVDPDEFVSDIRIVDDGSGNLERNLVEGIVGVLRPSGERYFVRYLDFSDGFRRTFDWEVVSGTAIPDLTAGRVVLGNPAVETVIKTDMPNDATWKEPQIAVQFSLTHAAGLWGELRFNYVDEFNFYAVRLNPSTKTVRLDRVVTGVRTNLSTVAIVVFHPSVRYYLHAQVEETGTAGTFVIRFLLDGNLLGSVTDSGGPVAGKLAVACGIAQQLVLTFAELYQAPLQSTRIGPP